MKNGNRRIYWDASTGCGRWFTSLTRGSVVRVVALGLATAALLVQHWAHPAEHTELHNLHRHLLYIPIILMAFWHGWRGGLATAIVVSLAYFPHILRHWMHYDLTTDINRTLELLTYLVVGGVTGWLVDRLRGEQRNLRVANAQLEAKSGQLQAAMTDLTVKTREVFEAEEQLRQADRLAALGQLTTGLAHEIRNPLASIRGAAEILGDPAAPDQARNEFSHILIEETERLDNVLGNFLDYARSQKAEAAESGDLGRVAGKLSALLSHPLKEARVALETRLPAALPPLAISENLLQQALLNLLLNAIQAMAAQNGDRPRQLIMEASVNAATASRTGTAFHAGTMTVLISDTGPGISPAAAEHIFDPFYTTKPQGVGLGLSSVHKIVTSHGGRIRVDPAYTGGARITLTLPLA